jgi:hypothetical protein
VFQRVWKRTEAVVRMKPMFRVEILWLASDPILKLQGRLVADWAEQARCLVTEEVLPKGMTVDLTEVSYIDSVGEQLLKWFANVGAVFVAGNVYASVVCDRLGLPPMQRTASDASSGMGIPRRDRPSDIPIPLTTFERRA